MLTRQLRELERQAQVLEQNPQKKVKESSKSISRREFLKEVSKNPISLFSKIKK
jgi:hypothetical protein